MSLLSTAPHVATTSGLVPGLASARYELVLASKHRARVIPAIIVRPEFGLGAQCSLLDAYGDSSSLLFGLSAL